MRIAGMAASGRKADIDFDGQPLAQRGRPACVG